MKFYISPILTRYDTDGIGCLLNQTHLEYFLQDVNEIAIASQIAESAARILRFH